jgi:pimeloyl-ACP methyl ester carboxylesterase
MSRDLPSRRPRLRRWQGGFLLVSALLGAAALAGAGWLYWRQESLIFFPEPLPADYRFAVPGAEEVRIAVDGASLSALHLKLPAPRGVVFFLHGNGGNLASWFTNAEFYREVNFDLFMIDYRGYGKSTGRIESEAQLRADVRAAWDYLAPLYAGKPKVIFGRSLGTALAAGLAADLPQDEPPALTLLVSPYCSLRELMKLHYPLLPTALLRYPLDTCQDAARLAGPLLLFHGEQDALIPIIHSERILARAPAARLLRVGGAAHNDIHLFAPYLDGLRKALHDLP